MAQINIGDVVHMTGSFYNTSGVSVDPGVVTVVVSLPSLAQTTYTNVSSPAVTKSSVGNYYLDLPITLSGTHRFRFVGTGANAAVEEGSFSVDVAAF